MTTPADRFSRADVIFDAALDLPAEERAAFAERACEGDTELCAQVLRLIRSYSRSGEFLESPALRYASPLLDETDVLRTGTDRGPERVGQFRVLGVLGRGGMGDVYLAERADGMFEQRVALKVMQRNAPSLVRRFLDERRILARLDHPRIARLFDGGLTSDGRPYFAMEVVDGEPIDHWCDARALDVGRRLELFGAVCDAVSYAHRHLVVHRDIKPSNILVTADGEVKLLDFGIAKLISADEHRADGPLTRTDINPMTPEYAAPEQVRGGEISTATDVYALGVLLYKLLAGRMPYELRGQSPAEIERLICEAEPPPPSAAYEAGPSVADRGDRARRRGTSPERLQRLLRGDLDLIVRQALRKEPERRYHSAAALREDLERFTHGLPVRARPDSAVYRMRRFVGRNRAGVSVVLGLVVLLSVGVLWERILRERAEAETRKARAVQEYIVSVFDVADPFGYSEGGGEVTARMLLDRGADRVDSALAGQADAQAELRGVLGRVYAKLGLYEAAVPQLERALQQRKELYGARHPAVADASDRLGVALLEVNRLDEAERLLGEALDVRREMLGDLDTATAASLDHLATLLQERSRYDEAEPLFREALAARRAALGGNDPEVAASLGNLGLLLYLKGDYDGAEPMQREALAIQIRALGERHPRTAQTLNNLAQVQQLRGKVDEAETLFRRALASKRAILGDTHPTVTLGMNNLAWLLAMERGKLDEAEALTRQALALDRRIFGDRHAYPASSMSNLAVILTEKGRMIEAEQLHREVLTLRRSLYGDTHASVARTLSLLAAIRYQRGDAADAAAMYRQAIAMYDSLLSVSHPSALATRVGLARVLRDRGDQTAADSLFRFAIDRLDATKPAQLPTLVSAMAGLGRTLAARGRTAEAIPLLERTLTMSLQRYGEEHWRTAEARLALGEALLLADERARGAELVKRSAAALERYRASQPVLAGQARAAAARLEH